MGVLRVCLLSGGTSPEREISLRSGQAVSQALREAGHSVIPLDPANPRALAFLSKESVDCVFIALHGLGGEDGAIQGWLETMHIPYTGSGVLASALAMNKVMSRGVWCLEQLPQPRYEIAREQLSHSPVGFPCVVKPARSGSTIGISIVKCAGEMGDAVLDALQYDSEYVLIEEFLHGREVTVGVIEDPETRALPVLEIVPKHEFYDYETKYTRGLCEYHVPASFSSAVSLKIQQTAIQAYRAIGCRDFGRVDMIWSSGKAYLLELNTIPGMTSMSLLPRAAAADGIDFAQLVDKIVKRAMMRVHGDTNVQAPEGISSECFNTS